MAVGAGFREVGVERAVDPAPDGGYDDLVRYDLLAGEVTGAAGPTASGAARSAPSPVGRRRHAQPEPAGHLPQLGGQLGGGLRRCIRLGVRGVDPQDPLATGAARSDLRSTRATRASPSRNGRT